jgi:hypothetical protein
LANIATTPVTVVNTDGTVSKTVTADRISQGIDNAVSGIKQAVSPAGVNLFKNSNSSVKNQTDATAKKIGN